MPYRLPLALNLSLNLNLFYWISWSRAGSATPAVLPKEQVKSAHKPTDEDRALCRSRLGQGKIRQIVDPTFIVGKENKVREVAPLNHPG